MKTQVRFFFTGLLLLAACAFLLYIGFVAALQPAAGNSSRTEKGKATATEAVLPDGRLKVLPKASMGDKGSVFVIGLVLHI